jgi:predicted alpha/beta-fold hydrolase
MADGTGDRLTGALSPPNDPAPGKPLVILIHGLSGCEESPYMLESARYFATIGHPVLRLNLRGSVPTQPHCVAHYHAGSDEDLAVVLDQLSDRPEVADGIILMGFSLGANILLKFLGARGVDYPIRAAISVSAPIDLAATVERFLQPRNRAYHAWILRHMKRDALAARALVPREAKAIRAARTIYEFDDRVVAPRNGFANAQDYYRRCSATRFLGAVRVPTLVIHSLDDPWIPARGYLDLNWASNPYLTLLMTERGGHVGFHDAKGAWHNRSAGLFLRQPAFETGAEL